MWIQYNQFGGVAETVSNTEMEVAIANALTSGWKYQKEETCGNVWIHAWTPSGQYRAYTWVA